MFQNLDFPNLALILADDDGPGLSLFIPAPSEIFWSLIITIIIVVAFFKFFLPKFNKVLEERRDKIEGNIAEAAKTRKQADEQLAEYNTKLRSAKDESVEIIDNAKSFAAQTKQKAVKEAEVLAKQKIEAAEKSIDDEVETARNSLKGETVELAANIASQMLKDKYKDPKEQSKDIENFIENVCV
jgi:F-type H+-transporting ATPase subunit b